MEFTRYVLEPQGPFRLGEGEEEGVSDFPHSDTLFGGLCHAWRILYGRDELEAMLELSRRKPQFLITSVFPMLGDIPLFPKPLISFRAYQGAEPKEIKKISWVDDSTFRAMCGGETARGEGMMASADALKKKFKVEVRERVSLDRIESSSNLYRMESVVYDANGLGLWLGARFYDSGVKRKFEASLNLLGEEGIGGLRSIGMGRFRLRRAENVRIDLPEGTGAFTTLSLYSPKPEEVPTIQNGRMRLLTRSCWTRGARDEELRARRVRMISEGAVLKRPQGALYGRMIDLSPREPRSEFSIWRWGYAFPVGVRDEELQCRG